MLVILLAAAAVVAFLLLKGWDKEVNDNISGGIVTTTGSFTCLPLKGEILEEQALCELGLKSADEKYYALDISKVQDVNTDLKAEDSIAVTGVVQSVKERSPSGWDDYDLDGVILVHTLLRTR